MASNGKCYRIGGHTERVGDNIFDQDIERRAVRPQADLARYNDVVATSLISWGLDFKIVQTLLRHANPTTTLAIYAQGIDTNRLAAQGAMMRAVPHPVSPVVQ
jgi:integrase